MRRQIHDFGSWMSHIAESFHFLGEHLHLTLLENARQESEQLEQETADSVGCPPQVHYLTRCLFSWMMSAKSNEAVIPVQRGIFVRFY
jgi:hypothetical protein